MAAITLPRSSELKNRRVVLETVAPAYHTIGASMPGPNT
jgi:hypothetical protein